MAHFNDRFMNHGQLVREKALEYSLGSAESGVESSLAYPSPSVRCLLCAVWCGPEWIWLFVFGFGSVGCGGSNVDGKFHHGGSQQFSVHSINENPFHASTHPATSQ